MTHATQKTITSKKSLIKTAMETICTVIAIAIIIAVTWAVISGLWDKGSQIVDADEKWNQLANTSPNHLILVNTYRDCRSQAFGGTRAECLLVTNDYGKLSGISDQDLNNIIIDIKSISDLITLNYEK